jgi:hypothetical protein
MLWVGVVISLPWIGGGENTFSSWPGSLARRRLGRCEAAAWEPPQLEGKWVVAGEGEGTALF